ncbi:Tryptophan aminotransferase-related protein 4 [Camellia lanceoleosa]|uniref:Tryptophan aminotransferase-related protein 4 n=1 Tax=Camellia lanceoleosa TaxID=1840588 RepID=A0ACC0HJU5_9ERIC|nr:Tryptophan aminotransferase-related protein 4 [Camellia lanceoleosa]
MAGKIDRAKYGMCLGTSVVVNLLLIVYLVVGEKWKLSWSIRAAEEAEDVAAQPCSGHGRAYLDGLVVDGKPVCECNTCFGGPDCSQFSPACSADVDSGNPLFLEPYWMQHAAKGAVVVAGWHRMSYTFNGHSIISEELEKHIIKLHERVGNAKDPYKSQTNFFRSMDYKFVGDTSMWKNTSDVNMNMIEFVTSPNNPDGQLKKAVLRGSSVKTIHDYAYYWPHFTAIPAPADEDLMLFTLSKLTGHAGSRFGWALIKDEEVYERMLKYTDQISIGVSHDTQLIALQLLKAIFQGNNGSDIFEFGFTTMRKRWEILSKALSESNRFSIQKIEPQFCTFYQQLRGPSPAYAWLKCERDEEEDCYEVLRENGIIGRRGSVYGAERRYVRLSLIKTQDDFDLLMLRFNSLLSQENYYGIETLM